jgi:hypothetical protein
MKTRALAMTGLAAIAVAHTNPALATEVFHSPSKNIYCMVLEEGSVSAVDCEIIERTNGRPIRPVPADCDLEWGNRFFLENSGRAQLICTGDTLRGSEAFVLPYGERLDYFGITCSSSETGIECINDDGHGFKISKGRQTLY